ncbi:MAG: hypothetical protein KDD36_00950 [Flavobacteriales bacterium]|nr:hypothetical protein [Flavobacteriales bacterium]
MKVAVFLNSYLGIPALEEIHRSGMLGLVVIPSVNHSGTIRVQDMINEGNLPYVRVSQDDMSTRLPDIMRKANIDITLVFTFPYRIPENVLNAPILGSINFHFGKLPKYRGAEPVFWQIRNGEKEGAIAVHRMTADLDAGPVYLQKTQPISPGETHGLHMIRLAFRAVEVLKEAWPMITDPAFLPIPQERYEGRHANKPRLNDLLVDWTCDAEDIAALVRSCNPWNRGAIASFKGMEIRITQVSPLPSHGANPASPGTILTSNEVDGVTIQCGSSTCVRLDVVSMDEGIMTGIALSRLGFPAGDRFENLAKRTPPVHSDPI